MKILICKTHGGQKAYLERIVKGKIRREYICDLCTKEKKNKYRKNNHEKILASAKEYRNKNRNHINSSRRGGTYRDSANKYASVNKHKILKQKSIYKKNRWNTDPVFRIRETISTSIRRALKTIGSTKNNFSFLEYVEWTTESLKKHIEQQFEPWMTWNNQGIFNSKTWDDNDPTTWTWNLDHIIPQSDLPYINMEDDNFKKCWTLSNLRPYSSKQNVIDGGSRVRHTT